MSDTNMTTIMSMKRIEVFGPNKPTVRLDKDKQIKSVKPNWQGKKNRIQIIIGQQQIPTICLEWAMIKSMIEAKIITVGTSTEPVLTAKEKAEAKKAKTAATKEANAAAKLAEEAGKAAGTKLPPKD